MVTLCWQGDGRNCSVDFHSIDGARACAAILQTRDKIHGVLLLDADGEPLDALP
jgi:hypothetical protein